MSGLLIGAIVVASVFALIAIKAVFTIGPLLDENEALRRYSRMLEQRAEEIARQTGWKLTNLELRLERQTEITNAAFRRETDLFRKLAKREGRDVWFDDDEPDYSNDPDYIRYLKAMDEAEDELEALCPGGQNN